MCIYRHTHTPSVLSAFISSEISASGTTKFTLSLDPEIFKPALANKIPCIGSVAILLGCSLLRSVGTRFCLNPSAQTVTTHLTLCTLAEHGPHSLQSATAPPALSEHQSTHTHPATCTLAPPSGQMKSDTATISNKFNVRLL